MAENIKKELTDEDVYNMSEEEFNKFLQDDLDKLNTTEVADEPTEQPTEEVTETPTEEVAKTDENQEPVEQPKEETPVETSTDNASNDESTSNDNKQEETPETYTIRANKQDYTLTLDEIKNLASKGIDYTKKTQQFKEYLPVLDALKQQGIKPESINVLIDVAKGNKEAIKSIIKANNIDPMDLDDSMSVTDDDGKESKPYAPQEYRPNYAKQELDEVVARLSQEPEYYKQTISVVSSLDDVSKDFLQNNPAAIEGLQNDIKSGEYAKTMTYANTLAVRDNFSKPVLEYYINAARELAMNNIQRAASTKDQDIARERQRIENRNKVVASNPVATPPAKDLVGKDAEDAIFSMSTEEFQKYLESIK